MADYRVIRSERVDFPYDVRYKGHLITVAATIWGTKLAIRRHKKMLEKMRRESKNFPNYPEVYNTD